MSHTNANRLTIEEKIEVLRHINERYTIEELKKLLGEETNSDLLSSLFNILYLSIDNINVKLSIGDFEYLLFCCTRILELTNDNSELRNSAILDEIINIEKKIRSKTGEIDRMYAMWRIFFKQIKEKIDSIGIVHQSDTNEHELTNDYNYIHYLVFVEKSYIILKKFMEKYPHIVSLKDNKDKTILMNIIKNYMKIFKSIIDIGEYDYFEDVVKLICSSKEFICTDEEYDCYIQRIDKVIEHVRSTEHNKRNLRYIESKLRKIKSIIVNKRKQISKTSNQENMSVQKKQSISEKLSILYGIRDIFSDDVIKEVSIILKKESLQEYIGRIDLTKKIIFTIDGAGAQALDDGFSLEKTKDGYILGIHISDVSHYIKEDSCIDKEALARTSTLYLASHAIPMIPNELGNGICSLNPNQNKRAISCFVRLDLKGNIEEYAFYKTLINSSQQVIYDHVGNILTNGCNNAELRESLAYLFELSNIEVGKLNMCGIAEQILAAGNLDLSCDKLDKAGYQMVAPFMIMANRLAASHFYEAGLPFVYRVNVRPGKDLTSQKLVHLKQLLQAQTLTIEECDDIAQVVLDYESQGAYSVDNIGHYSLGYSAYSHWTSPIRRYPDLLNQRMMDIFLFEQAGKKASEKEQELLKEQWDSKLRVLVAHINKRQRQIKECRKGKLKSLKLKLLTNNNI